LEDHTLLLSFPPLYLIWKSSFCITEVCLSEVLTKMISYQRLKKEAPRIQFGKIDVTHQHDLRKEFNIREFPTVKSFVDSTRDVPEMPFRMTASKDIHANYGIQKNTLVVLKKVGVQNGTDVESFVSPTSVKIFDVPVENHILLFTPANSETFNVIYENYKSAAAEFRGKVCALQIRMPEDRQKKHSPMLLVKVDVPATRILNLTSDAKYKMPADKVTVENLKEFCQSYLKGKAKLHVSSEEIPEDWDKMPVKVLVGKNFNRIVFNKIMTVLVMFCPWSYDCRKLLPTWDKLGDQYENHKDIIIAKTDVRANNILSIGLEHYPFFRLFPAGPDYQVRTVLHNHQKMLLKGGKEKY
uniref:Thioredoxin domain-containing protein n=1 Tax=Aquila chrysaetos chrysaetos TaxID=223781 RepID=A0A663EPP8_AQUCH